jgi:hypothetical protein
LHDNSNLNSLHEEHIIVDEDHQQFVEEQERDLDELYNVTLNIKVWNISNTITITHTNSLI